MTQLFAVFIKTFLIISCLQFSKGFNSIFKYGSSSTRGSKIRNERRSSTLLSTQLINENYQVYATLSEDESELLNITSSSNIPIIKLIDIRGGWGDGSHPTTRLCLEFINKYVKSGDIVLDYGTGSGVLSILAAKKGAVYCYAVDVCEDSISAAKNNANLNGVADKIEVVHTRTYYVGNDYYPQSDVTVANILPGPLCKLAPIICAFTKEGGWLCLSGIRRNQLSAVQDAYKMFVDQSTEIMNYGTHEKWGEWVSWTVKLKVLTTDEKKDIQKKLLESTFG